MKLVAYIRTSTTRQNLGLEAQAEIIKRAATFGGHEILATYQEQEHGTNDNRVEFLRALEACKAEGALLCVAKVDRLSRNEKFSFEVRDNLEAQGLNIYEAESARILTPLEFGFKVVFAADERRKISQRTKEALGALKAQGVKLGRLSAKRSEGGQPNATFTEEQRAASLRIRQEHARNNAANKRAFALLSQAQHLNLTEAATFLNDNGFQTPRGKAWTPTGVMRLKAMFG